MPRFSAFWTNPRRGYRVLAAAHGEPMENHMVETLRFESQGERLGCAIACAFIFSFIGIPICGAIAKELSAPMYFAPLGLIGFAILGGWIGYRR